ncbi:MAG: DUF2723 domain-containing protein [Gemmatimonadota bacterium]
MTAPRTDETPRPPYAWAAATAGVVFLIYLATLAPTTAFWDTSEYIAAAKVVGIPHPPGNPLFVLMAHVFGLLPLASSYAVRINLFAAVTSAAAAGFWFLVAERWLRSIVPVKSARLAAAFAGVLVGATSWTVWNQSTVNEKVYTVSLFYMALVTWLAVHWGDDAPGPHRDRWLILIAYLLALTSTNHMMGVLAAPAVAVYVLWTDARALLRPQVVIGIVLAVIIGLTPNYIFLPIRAAQHPPINEGEPVGFFSQALMDVLNRVQYGKPSVFARQADIVSQFQNYWQYFSWQYARDWGVVNRIATALFAVLGISGLVTLFKRDKRAGWAAVAMVGTLTVALILYLNFKYGFSLRPDITPSERHEVRERDYFFLCSFAFFGTMVALGIGAWMSGVANYLSDRLDERKRWLAALPLAGLCLIPLLGNRVTASRANEFAAHDLARDLLESVEPYSILITAGDNDTFPLWFAQEVEGIRPDVTLANLSLLNTDWHLRQIRRRETPEFDPAKSISLWRTPMDTAASGIPLGDSARVVRRTWTRPTTPVFSLSEQELDSLPELSKAPTQSLRFDSVEVRFGQDVIDKKDLAILLMIRDNIGKRPIYFSWSAGSYPDQTLGLTPYLVSQGLVRKLYTKPVVPHGSVVMSQGLGWMDLDRTKSLLWNAYELNRSARDRPRGWVDAPSQSIIDIYSIVYAGYGATIRERGDSAQAIKADSVARKVSASLAPQVGKSRL